MDSNSKLWLFLPFFYLTDYKNNTDKNMLTQSPNFTNKGSVIVGGVEKTDIRIDEYGFPWIHIYYHFYHNADIPQKELVQLHEYQTKPQKLNHIIANGLIHWNNNETTYGYVVDDGIIRIVKFSNYSVASGNYRAKYQLIY